MANYFRTTSSMLARIETLTKELLGATPYGELNDGLGVSSGIIKRLAHEMQSKDIQLEKYLMLEKRVATQLREDPGNRQRNAHAVQNQQRASPRVRDFACQRRPFRWYAGARSFSGPAQKNQHPNQTATPKKRPRN